MVERMTGGILITQLLLAVVSCQAVTVPSVSETSISLTWAADRNIYLNFTVSYSTEDGQNYTQAVEDSDWSGETVVTTLDQNLDAGHLYKIEVLGVNQTGYTILVGQPIEQATKPYPPTNVTVRHALTEAMDISWVEENVYRYSPTYIITYKDLTNTSASTEDIPVNTTAGRLTQLQPGHTYSISVLAVSFGVESNQTTPITDNTVPLSPMNLTVVALNESALYAMWVPNPRSSQEGYEVSYGSEGGVQTPVTCMDHPPTECTVMTSGDTPGQHYIIEVKAVKGQRASLAQSTGANTKPLPPGDLKPVNITTVALELTWQPPSGGKLDGYLVTLNPNDSSQSLQNKSDVGALFDGLTSGKTYQVSVVAFSGQERSDPFSRVFWTVPLAPKLHSETTNDSILLTWDSPAGQRDNYTITTKGNNSDSSKVQTEPGTGQKAVISDLRAGSTYTVRVTALSGDQQSEPATLTGLTTVPNPVEDLRVSDADLESVVVMWRAPLPPESAVEEYKVTVAPLDGYPKYVSPQPELYVSYNITGLVAGTPYTVTVQAVSGGRAKESPVRRINVSTIPVSVESLVVTTETQRVQVTWSLAADMNYDLLNISLSNSSGFQETETRNKGSTLPTNHVFANLESGSLYTVTIVTSLSDGTVGRPINKTAITKPVPIKGILLTGEPDTDRLSIEWTVHPAEAHGYLVTITDLSDGTVADRNETVPGQSALITGLSPGHHYTLTVQAYVDYTGTIVYSDGISKNATTKPLPVVGLSAAVHLENITVTWQASAHPDSRQDDFQFHYRPVLRDPSSAWIEAFTNAVTADIPAPMSGEKYVLRVWSRAGLLLSDVSEISTVVAPKAPQSVFVITENTTTDTVYIQLVTDEHLTYASHWNFTFTPRAPDSLTLERTVTHPYINPIEMSGLRPGESYTIEVFSVTAEETKSQTSVITSATLRPVRDSEVWEVHSTNSTLRLAYSNNSPIFDLYHFQLDTQKPVSRGVTELQEIPFGDLTPGQSVQVKFWVSSSNVTSDHKLYRFQTYPNMVQSQFFVFSTEINVSLTRPDGVVDYYNITCFDGHSVCGFYHLEATVGAQDVNFTGLRAYQDYIFSLLTSSGDKFVTKNVSRQTSQSAPSAVQKVSAIVTSPNTVLVRWERPAQSNGDITKYQVKYIGKLQGKPDDENTKLLEGWKVPPTNVTLANLQAGYTYTFSVSAYTVTFGPAGQTTLTVAAYPPPFKESLNTEDLLPASEETPSPTSVKLKFVNAFSSKGGEVIAYTIIVSTDNSTEQKMPILLPGWQIAQNDPAIKAYQAVGNCSNFFSETSDCQSVTRRRRNAELGSRSFTVGTETGCGEKVYCNGPLKPDTEYYIALRAFTAGGPNDTPYSKKIRTASLPEESDPGPVIGGVVAGLLIIAIIVLVVVLYRIRQRKPNMYKKEDHEMHEDLHVKRSSSRRTKASRIVKLTDFPDHFQLMSADSDYRFAEEFEELREVGRDQSCNAAELPQNRAKNRFTNILPYDHSRVKLLPTDDEEGSDYINANYMPGYSSRREYVVTQGPLHSTRDDFWRLLWEQNSCNIIMLTRCVEKGREKCDHYWPQNSENMFYGDLQVAILNETKFPDWTITEFRVSLGDNSRKVRHFHYTAWPDFGVPERPQSLVKFVTTVRGKLTSEGGPQLVHCSAGVGRSGTYIALDRLLQHIQHNDWVDPYSIVHEMRCQRVWMVQTEQQYICIHQCLLSVLQGYEEEPVYCNQAHDNVGFEDKKDTLPLCPPETEDDEGINVEIM